MPHIELALSGKLSMLRTVNGVADPDEPKEAVEQGDASGLVAFLRARAS